MFSGKRILASPLDWGLGHATRLIPILKDLEKENELILGVCKGTENLLNEHFPNAILEEVPAYDIRNSKSGTFFSYVKMSKRILKVKKQEEQWVDEYVKKNQVDVIISDSRFGFRHPAVDSFILSHQLNLKFPAFWKFPGLIAQKVNQKWLSAFNEIWIPDEQNHELSGELSEEAGFKTRFVGTQSRFKLKGYKNSINENYILVILSGPEPQRSELEHIILHQTPLIRQKVIIVGGKPNHKTKTFDCANACWYSHLETEELAALITHADLVISRSGYSSLMDYKTLKTRSIFLIPTPGQSEQIYLANRMKAKDICDFSSQKNFNLTEAVLTMDAFKGFVDE